MRALRSTGSIMRGVSRFGALVAAAALFLGNAGPLVHAIVAEHATCPEHGELIELSDHPESAVANENHGPLYTTGAELPDAETHEHDHCVLATHVSQEGVARVHLGSQFAGEPQLSLTFATRER